jgi:VWFA-related protein
VPAQQAQTASPEQSASNQVSSGSAEDGITTIRASVQEVNLIFTATNKHGRFKRDLKPTDLAVLDDGKPPAAVNSFRSETDLPLRVGLVLDVSGSITDRFTFEQDSAIRFFSQILRPKTDKAFVLAFDSVCTLTQDFTDDVNLLAQGIKKLTPGGGSAVRDAIHLAATEKLMKARADGPVRRVIILISDGEDNQSRVTTAQVIEAAHRAEVTVYTISTNTSADFSRGDKAMRALAEETGGRVFYPNKVDDVVKAFKQIEDELRSQYALSYKPADFDADGHYRRIEIQSHVDKNLVIRARKGYFAPSH